MALYVIRHQHPADRCPGADPQMGPMLLQHLSPENARRYGVTIQADAVVNGAHAFYLIVDAEDPARLEQFLTPFRQAGTVEVLASSTCGAVVEAGGCALVV